MGVNTQPPGPRPPCPQCGGMLERIPRGWFDRLLSLVSPRRRYRCRTFACKWEGILRDSRLERAADTPEKRYDRRIDGS